MISDRLNLRAWFRLDQISLKIEWKKALTGDFLLQNQKRALS
jgi:hypothetical protein